MLVSLIRVKHKRTCQSSSKVCIEAGYPQVNEFLLVLIRCTVVRKFSMTVLGLVCTSPKRCIVMGIVCMTEGITRFCPERYTRVDQFGHILAACGMGVNVSDQRYPVRCMVMCKFHTTMHRVLKRPLLWLFKFPITPIYFSHSHTNGRDSLLLPSVTIFL